MSRARATKDGRIKSPRRCVLCSKQQRKRSGVSCKMTVSKKWQRTGQVVGCWLGMMVKVRHGDVWDCDHLADVWLRRASSFASDFRAGAGSLCRSCNCRCLIVLAKVTSVDSIVPGASGQDVTSCHKLHPCYIRITTNPIKDGRAPALRQSPALLTLMHGHELRC